MIDVDEATATLYATCTVSVSVHLSEGSVTAAATCEHGEYGAEGDDAQAAVDALTAVVIAAH